MKTKYVRIELDNYDGHSWERVHDAPSVDAIDCATHVYVREDADGNWMPLPPPNFTLP